MQNADPSLALLVCQSSLFCSELKNLACIAIKIILEELHVQKDKKITLKRTIQILMQDCMLLLQGSLGECVMCVGQRIYQS